MYTYALSLVGNAAAAEDVIHDAITSVLGSTRLPKELKPYLFRCIRNASMDVHRKNSREPALESVFEVSSVSDPSLGLMADEMLARVSPDERETIVLKLYSGMTFQEIADTRNVSVNTASSWYRRGIDKMRAEHKEEKHG